MLVVRVGTAYFSPGMVYFYNRSVVGDIKIFRSDTLEPMFQERLYFAKATDKYSYATFADLVKDFPHAVDGLNQALMGLVSEFAANLKASRSVCRLKVCRWRLNKVSADDNSAPRQTGESAGWTVVLPKFIKSSAWLLGFR